MTNNISIKNRFSGNILYTYELPDGIKDSAYCVRLGYAVKSAVAKEVNLAWADLTGVKLTFADLTGANLSGANLTEAIQP